MLSYLVSLHLSWDGAYLQQHGSLFVVFPRFIGGPLCLLIFNFLVVVVACVVVVLVDVVVSTLRFSVDSSLSSGFASSLSRTVIVYENGDVVGIYDGTRVGVSGGLILLSTNPGGGYFISDLLGGYYEFGRSYGNDYAAPSTIQISGNTVTAGVGNCAFGPVELTNGEISDDHQTMTWRATLVDYAFGFDVELTKITN